MASPRASPTALKRLRQDYLRLTRDPVPYIKAVPQPSNILEWHYVVKGPEDTPYYGGYYHGVLLFPKDYPFKPPRISMSTPNGRFQINTRLCLSISDFHPDTWNPAWSVATILTGLLSFMVENTSTLGSIETSDEMKRKLAIDSLAFNLNDQTFCQLFPKTCEEIRHLEQQRIEKQTNEASRDQHRLYAVVDLYGPIAAVKVIGEQKNVITHQAPPESFEVDQPAMVVKREEEVTFAPTHSENIRLENGGRCACRFKSYSKGLVVTSVPLPSGQLFQVEVMEMMPTWSGTLSIGVTMLPPAQVISAIKAQQLPGQSFVIAANGEKSTVLYIGGQEMDHLPADINLLALKVGDTVGLLRQGSGALHFFLNGVHMVKLSCTVPEGVYGLVDLYGQCVKVALRPLTTWCDEVMSSGMRSSSQPSPFTAQATPFTAQATPFTAQATPFTAQATPFIPQATPFTAQAPPITPQATPFTTQATPTSLSAPADKRPSLPGPTVLPKSLGVPWVIPSGICSYQKTCNTLVCESLLLPEVFFAMSERSRCLCKDCCVRGGIVSPVKSAGSPNMKYTLPFGWVEYKLELPPRAKSLRAEELWNVAYHGTAVGNVRSILDCGGLLLPGDRRLGGDEVKRPDGHYTEDYKPSNFDVNRIFMTPSAKYCGLGEVYTKPCRHTISGKEYSAKVMFQVLIEPGTFDISAQTVDPANGKIDDHFNNSELEWSTKSHVSIILRHMYVKLERRTQ